MYYTNKDIIRYTNGSFRTVSDKIIREDQIAVFCGRDLLGRYPCTDKERDLLALGLAYCLGFQVEADTPVEIEGRNAFLPELAMREERAGSIEADLFCQADRLLDAMGQLREMPGLFAETGGTHNGAWVYQGRLQTWTEDISRHCMVDKLIGAALRNEWAFSELAILLSCRVSRSILDKLLSVGVPIVVSMSAVTDRAMEAADEHGMTLAGFARGNRMNIYTGKRIGKGERSD